MNTPTTTTDDYTKLTQALETYTTLSNRLAAIEAKPLGAGEALVEEAFEGLRLDQLLEDR